MKIRDLFLSDVTRDIPPVVYFHEQSPEKLAAEVSEYIVTGGWPADHPNHRRVPNGIHEQYVRLLDGISAEMKKPGGPDLPTVWISGFYGSGKSSFAKLLGLALNGVELPDGTSLAEAWLRRDSSPLSAELRASWSQLRQQVDPFAVVFDIGSRARDNEHVHAVVVREVQRRLGYCSTEPLVADFELKLERDGEYARFEQMALQVLGKPWSEIKDRQMAEEDFSLVLHMLYPERYAEPMSWYMSRGGTHSRSESPEEAVSAIRDMLKFRRPGAQTTLFLVIDEVSQYVLSNTDRADRLRAFASALGASLRGRVWLLALGQQKLEDAAGDSFLMWAKDRFPPRLRVHLAPTNITDVVHRRLLQKRPDGESTLRALFERHRPDLKLFAYGCEEVSADEFVDVYPLLPGYIDLLLQITSAMRVRSTRVQGDDQAIRGLLQMLGELFRAQKLAEMEVGQLVTMDRIYEVQSSALDADAQASMARVMSKCAAEETGLLLVRVAKGVSLLELIQDTVPTTAQLVAQCLYDALDRGNNLDEVSAALERLRAMNLLSYSEKDGYKLQSSVGEEWESERRDISVNGAQITDQLQRALRLSIDAPETPKLSGRPFPLQAVFSDGRQANNVTIKDARDDAAMTIDLRFVLSAERDEAQWVRRSSQDELKHRLVWVVGETDPAEGAARELQRSAAMIKKYTARRESLNAARKMLLLQEEGRREQLEMKLREVLERSFMEGKLYFQGRPITPGDHGGSFAAALTSTANRVLPDLFPHFIVTQIMPSELMQLVETDLSGPSPKFLSNELGLLTLDGGKYVPECAGVVPQRVLDFVRQEAGVTGARLLERFGSPPYGYTANVVKACAAALLRGSKLRIQPESGAEISAMRDAGVREIFDKDRAFKRAGFLPAEDGDISFSDRAKLARMFEQHFGLAVDREDAALADAVVSCFPARLKALRELLGELRGLPGEVRAPEALVRYEEALGESISSARHTRKLMSYLKIKLDAFNDGHTRMMRLREQLTEPNVALLRAAHRARTTHLRQLVEAGALPSNLEVCAQRLEALFAQEEPWRGVDELAQDIQDVEAAYLAERRAILNAQERETSEARGRVKGRDGFSTLTSNQSNTVLRHFLLPIIDEEATTPALATLHSSFAALIKRAEEHANESLDSILSEGEQQIVQALDLKLKHREVATVAEVEALVEDIRARLLKQIERGVRVRLL
jgi:hypothetical protein